MSRKPSGKFNQKEYMAQWKAVNMKHVGAAYKNEFVLEFKEACDQLGLKQSDVFRQAMIDTIKKAAQKS